MHNKLLKQCLIVKPTGGAFLGFYLDNRKQEINDDTKSETFFDTECANLCISEAVVSL